jgi:3-carboxy-cis,cis-muconate cycloisomerase
MTCREKILPAWPSSYLTGLLGDPEITALIGEPALLREMLRVESSLAKVEGRLGVIPSQAADAIVTAAEKLSIEPAALAKDVARDGVPVPGLVRRLRDEVGEPYADYVHFGPTSQDIVDTAFVLTSLAALVVLDARLAAIVENLGELAEQHAGALMAGRTRSQLASATTFGLKVAGWALPLHRHRARLLELRNRLSIVSLSGSTGNLATLGPAGEAVEAALAEELNLSVPAGAWHNARDTIVELGHWLALVTGSIGKMGADFLLLAQNEIGEVRTGGGAGRSSTMPHKANPVGAEALVTLARMNGDRVATLHHAMLHAHERDGAAWTMEWLIVPELAVAAGASTRLAGDLLATLEVDTEAMRARATAAPGLLASELAVFALSAVMSRREALRAVESAAKSAVEARRTLVDVLEEALGPVIEWGRLRAMDAVVEAASFRTRRMLTELRRPI